MSAVRSTWPGQTTRIAWQAISFPPVLDWPPSQGLTIQSSAILARARAGAWPVEEEGGRPLLRAPGGYKFYILDLQQPKDRWGRDDQIPGKDLVDVK